jgi:cell division transport system permease protein
MGGVVIKARFPRRELAVTVARNAVRYLIRGSIRSWARNLGATAPALGSMTLLLLLTGLCGLAGFALHNLADIQAHDASLIHVYLRDDAGSSQVASLRAKLEQDRRVQRVTYVSKEEALARAQRRPGLPEIAAATESNPFPASLDVQVRKVDDVGSIDALVRTDPAADPVVPTSYDRGAYQRIQQVLVIVGLVGAGFMALLAFVAVTVTANSIRAAIMARREEVTIMQLVGASRWMVRGPFVIEGAFTGAVAGLVAALLTLAVTLAGISAGAASFAQLAPGLSTGVAVVAALFVFLAGLGLGSGSSLVGIRRHLES